MMRTTINLPNDVYEAARSVATAKRVSLDLERAGKPLRA